MLLFCAISSGLVVLISSILYIYYYRPFCRGVKFHDFMYVDHWLFKDITTRYCKCCRMRQVYKGDRGWGVAVYKPDENLLDIQQQTYKKLHLLLYKLGVEAPDYPNYLYTHWNQGW